MNKVIVMNDSELKDIISDAIAKNNQVIIDSVKGALNPPKTNMTVKEAAEKLNVTELTIRNYIKKGFISATKIGRRIVINQESLDKALSEVKSFKYRR